LLASSVGSPALRTWLPISSAARASSSIACASCDTSLLAVPACPTRPSVFSAIVRVAAAESSASRQTISQARLEKSHQILVDLRD
jgi:hypothetical protein